MMFIIVPMFRRTAGLVGQKTEQQQGRQVMKKEWKHCKL